MNRKSDMERVAELLDEYVAKCRELTAKIQEGTATIIRDIQRLRESAKAFSQK